MNRILIGITIFAFLTVIAGAVMWIKLWPNLQRQQTAARAAVVEEAWRAFQIDHPQHPEEVTGTAELIRILLGANPHQKSYLKSEFEAFLDPEGRIIDVWARPFRLERLEPTVSGESAPIRLRSAGKNGVLGDGDDITSQDFHHGD